MNLFDDLIVEIKKHMTLPKHEKIRSCDINSVWPESRRPGLIMACDTGVELGSPAMGSLSLLLWSPDPALVNNGEITLSGPDIGESHGKSLPFTKIVILHVEGFHENNCHTRHRELSLLHHKLYLEGYMVRAQSKYMREWSRVANHALGLSLTDMGNSLIQLYRNIPYVKAAEIHMSTINIPGYDEMINLGESAAVRIAAMNRMNMELAFDCDECDYQDVCREVDSLKAMKKKLEASHG